MSTPSPDASSAGVLDEKVPLKWDAAGLLTVVVQDHVSGEIRMVAHANREAVAKTLATGKAFFFSRSRQQLWEKGATSGHGLRVRQVLVDCDGDCLIYAVDALGPSCHTGAETCFFRVLGSGEPVEATLSVQHLMGRLETELEARKESSAGRSYTKSLLDGGAAAIGAKLREEASELAVALDQETDDRVAKEAADLVYHALVGLRWRGVAWRAVLEVLNQRMGTSGHVEKASRKPSGGASDA